MTLSDEYKAQAAWRSWDKILSLCPINEGQKILDLGCGTGDVSKLLIDQKLFVLGIDRNSELLEVAKQRAHDAEFIQSDLQNLDLKEFDYDGLWCSFTSAYFPNFESVFLRWQKYLKPKHWVCIVEIDDLFGHRPISDFYIQKLEEFYNLALREGTYDFRMGGKIAPVLRTLGYQIKELEIADKEFTFEGAAEAEILKAWENRFDRMPKLKEFFGSNFYEFKRDFLNVLRSPSHASICKVKVIVAMQ
jgi:ubiquinone/menaquinone biosynthesis C-methylase UbiE